MADGVGGVWEQQRNHYNNHVRDLSTREALQQRSEGPAQELKNFHNHIKRQLIMRFAYKQERLLDLCCGRGGDLHKWREAQVGFVKGLDISEREVEEARRRYSELRERRGRGPGGSLLCEFEAVDWLGSRPYEELAAGPASYGVVTCMFALHYFFMSEASLRTFLRNVATNLRHGGYFVGTIPSGRRVMQLLGGKPELRTPMLRLVRRWKGTTDGSLEYLVEPTTLERIAAEVGLIAVRDYMDPVLATCFKEEDLDAPFKHFRPFFLHSLQLDVVEAKPGGPPPPPPQPPSSQVMASSLFAAFVFQKVDSPEAVTLPMAPECQFMVDRTQGRGGGGGGGPMGPMGHPGGPHMMGHPGPMGHHGGPPQGMPGPYGMGGGGPPPPGFGGGGHGYAGGPPLGGAHGGRGGPGPGKRGWDGPRPGHDRGDKRGKFGGGPGRG
ncbi:hypothetical protein PLESTB_001390100 [Pleodorina starrii]|uniref:mRNA (guanine-N(7))-methyltransferase n=1 Tax=Pleodorina starrii TaxID=330485 RepID=A0A9W6BUY6_9CHLO|nr:hypothetical protein PLESTB_001390100 [Pleodorina starrii]